MVSVLLGPRLESSSTLYQHVIDLSESNHNFTEISQNVKTALFCFDRKFDVSVIEGASVKKPHIKRDRVAICWLKRVFLASKRPQADVGRGLEVK